MLSEKANQFWKKPIDGLHLNISQSQINYLAAAI